MYGEIHRMSTRNSLKSCTNSVQRLFLLRNFPLLNSVIFSEMRKSPPWRPASIDLDASESLDVDRLGVGFQDPLDQSVEIIVDAASTRAPDHDRPRPS